MQHLVDDRILALVQHALDAGEVCRPGPASTGWTDLGHHGQLLLG
jgi:hypothetical protein